MLPQCEILWYVVPWLFLVRAYARLLAPNGMTMLSLYFEVLAFITPDMQATLQRHLVHQQVDE
nr:MAG TPA: hypothetical protein [Caudoviricetes sp.]